MKIQLTLIFFLFNFNVFATSPQFIVCKGTYALCTTALCKPILGNTNAVSCDCMVKKGFSAGSTPCNDIKQTTQGQLISSRYFPISGYVRCTNKRPWAYCLDSPCLIDPGNTDKASCICSIKKNEGVYVVPSANNTKNLCTTGMYSSATVSDLNQITEFLKRNSDLQPFPLKVLNEN